MAEDWLPHGHESMEEQITIMVTNVDANLKRYGMGDESKFGDWYRGTFKSTYDEDYMPAYTLWYDEQTRTPHVTRKLKNIEKEMKPLTRALYAMLKGNILVRDEDLEVMRLPVRSDHKPHPAPVADMPPSFYVEVLNGNRLRIYYYPDGSTRKKGKPKGQHGVEIKWDFYDETVESPEAFAHSLFDTASPYTLSFDAADHGRKISIAMRWENTRGEKGPWSVMQAAYVP
ncbi:MAG: hypothetical protein LBJ39_02245 [Tannerellaceae bacterium]|jgi:hypothetical protein|nr:hypothetical protein [Tannerellaceae bacterium]